MNFLSSVLGGSFLGIAGVLGTGILDFLKQKQKDKHDLEMLQAQKDLILAQGANAVNLEDAKSFGASHESDKATYSNPQGMTGWLGMLLQFLMVGVDFLRGFTRPGMTWYLTFISTLLGVHAIVTVGLSLELLSSIVVRSVDTALNLTSFSVTWWFGSRGIGQNKR